MSEENLQAVIDVAKEAATAELEPFDLVDGRLLGVVLCDGQRLERIDLDEFLDQPRRKTGSVAVSDPVSFIDYVERHKHLDHTTLWGVPDAGRIVAVLNDHSVGEHAGYGDHRAHLVLPATPDWTHWLSLDGKLVDQESFAEHIEDGAVNVRDPEPAEMLEIAQTFHARTGVDFKSSTRLASGETRLQYEETTQARAGATGSIEIPSTFLLGLAPFEGSPTYEMTARFRYRINNGRLSLGYKLIRPDAVKLQAFRDVAAAITEATSLSVLLGVPRSG